MPYQISIDAIPFKNGRAQLDVFADTSPLVVYGLNAQWNYDGHKCDLHNWNTAYGFESDADNEFRGNKHRKALSEWLMTAHNVPPDTFVLLDSRGFTGDYDLD